MTTVEWKTSEELIPYPDAVSFMEARVAAIRAGQANELVWLLEHPPLYTGGTSADPAELLAGDRFPVYRTGRGGRYTYHGPGQRVAYVMLDLKRRSADVRAYVHDLERWIIHTLAAFSVRGEVRPDRIGVWVDRGDGREDKIAALGIRVRKWVTYHGIAINVEPDLTHFSGIVPCGIDARDYGVTSLVDLGLPVTLADVDAQLMASFNEIFATETLEPLEGR